MKKILINLFILSTLIFFSFVFLKTFVLDIYPTKTIPEYYAMIRGQEDILDGEVISQEQLDRFKKCGDDYKCFLNFYEEYNASTTIQKTFSNLALVLRDYPEYKDYCHQMAHGIGHAEYRKTNDLGKILSEFLMNRYFKNITSCGSGYYHGLMEEAVKGITLKEKLVEFFKDTCNQSIVSDNLEGECLHGLGHASFIQLEYNVPDALYVCDQVTTSTFDKFNCYTGVFMEANLSLPYPDMIEKVGDNSFIFPMCDQVKDELARRACFFESVLQFKRFAPTKKINGVEKPSYADMTNMCKIFNGDLYRLLCIRNISIRSVSENQESDLQKMCILNTQTKPERVMCVAGFANKITLSITGKKDEKYYQITSDICKNLTPSEATLCRNVIKNNPEKTYIVDEKDLKQY